MFDDNSRIGTEDPAWHPYPKCIPPKSGEYLVSIKKIWQDWTITDKRKVLEYNYSSTPWYDLGKYEKVVAWAYIPEPYQKES